MVRPKILSLSVAVAAGGLLLASVVGLIAGGGDGTRGSPARGQVTVVDFAFDPGTVTATAGDVVTWTNKDGATHTVTSEGQGPLDSGELEQGSSYEATFHQPGTYAYICTIHPTMSGTVEVTA